MDTCHGEIGVCDQHIAILVGSTFNVIMTKLVSQFKKEENIHDDFL